MPSGVWGTALLNCIAEGIIEVVQFYYCLYMQANNKVPSQGDFVHAGSQIVSFFNVVSLINYGDDNLKCVNPNFRKVYNHDRITSFGDWICMGITPAHKEEKFIEFKPVTQILFLKRTPVFVEGEYQTLVGRLEFTSIGKMMAFTDSKQLNWETMVVQQAVRELACYPMEVFNRFLKIFNRTDNQDFVLSCVLNESRWTVKSDDNICEYKPEFEMDCIPDVMRSTFMNITAVPGHTKLADILEEDNDQ